jgi:long-subunit acyl-CoA synthetase (AMP-forming)
LSSSEDVFALPNSSGTGGPPKTVMITHQNILVNVQQALHPGLDGIRLAQGAKELLNLFLILCHFDS